VPEGALRVKLSPQVRKINHPGVDGVPSSRRGPGWLLTAALIVLSGAVRLWASGGDLELDEIWSLDLARQAGSLGGVLTRIHHDNNHHLNTAYLLLIGDHAPARSYRLLAVIAGAATVAVASLRPLRIDRSAAAIWMALLASSFLLVQYGSEARGYALAALFAVLDLWLLDLYLVTRRRGWAAAFAASSILGLLSHLSFVLVLLPFLTWASLALLQGGARHRRDPLAMGLLAAPLAALGLLWVTDLRFLVLGGGPELKLQEVLRELIGATLGLPAGLAELAGPLVVVAAGNEVLRLAQRRRLEWVFFAGAILAAALLALAGPAFLAPRYFLVVVPFFLFLLALALDRLARHRAWGKAACGALLLAFAIGNGIRIERLATIGRGHYRDAVEFLLQVSPPGPVTVGSDHDFRNRMLLAYFAQEVPGGRSIAYLTPDRWTARDPTWIILHDFASDARSPSSLSTRNGGSYHLARQFPYYGLSGFNWYLYRMDTSP